MSFFIGAQKYNNINLPKADIRMMTYWQYIDGKSNFLDMIGELKKYTRWIVSKCIMNNKLEIYLIGGMNNYGTIQ